MKKINLDNYRVNVNTKDGQVSVDYDVKGSIKNILFDIRQQLSAVQLFEVMDIWKKIKDEKEIVILEEAEYKIIRKSIDAFKGYTENDYEFVKRITEAENFEIKKES